MESVGSFEMSVTFYHTTQRHISEHSDLHGRSVENLKYLCTESSSASTTIDPRQGKECWSDGHFTVHMCRDHLHRLHVPPNLYRRTVSLEHWSTCIFSDLALPLIMFLRARTFLCVPIKSKRRGLQSHLGRPTLRQSLHWMCHHLLLISNQPLFRTTYFSPL
jgi:hypothetical protein